LKDRPPDKASTRGGNTASRGGAVQRNTGSSSHGASTGQNHDDGITNDVTKEMRALKEEVKNLKRKLEVAKLGK